ncbi:60S ribosomal protein L39 [Cryptococcus neoformans C23]|nr:60S ribosomal protein L39 [Cryptococcus neoformans var. grubii AD2-60a]OWZ44816.1 60S ribosomal protein L39 [Cryptococcus neoformans var. grubii C23]OWZ45209.1 60S ribosomal protein L39 [Cryptococcus neoformans var. grubii AD1-83a]OXC85126.1 60S ribosomal protein L39 [Cryptococcus neoformans var. grubii AD1-7a]OXG22339.1 60S ribosomal protein L39 [Cryptococcus neoformans var. grubii Tu259-1]OXG33526.1 60S ribosomal protein L39 [Cryptococcus neoformans var. grubii Bt15]OXG42677.1 60S riboso
MEFPAKLSPFSCRMSKLIIGESLFPSINPTQLTMPSQKTFIVKQKLAKKARQNRPLPQWFRLKTDNKIQYNAKRRHWRRTKLNL